MIIDYKEDLTKKKKKKGEEDEEIDES